MQSSQKTQSGVILQPGAIGDCVLTLPLAEFMKESLALDTIDIIGRSEYIGILPGRTCIDKAVSMDTMELHRLFTDDRTFSLSDNDPLIRTFENYDWIITFLGGPDSSFEKNLIFTAYCTHSADVMTLQMKPAAEHSSHLTQFYIKQFVDQCHIPLTYNQPQPSKRLIKAGKTDIKRGRQLLKTLDIAGPEKPVVIQPGSGGKHKCWHLDNFLAVAKKLSAKGINVVFLLGPAELDRLSNTAVKGIDKVAKCLKNPPLVDVLGLLRCSAGYIGNDSGITHLAAALGIKTIVVFGPTDPALYGPIGPQVKVFTDNSKAFATAPSRKLRRQIIAAL